MLNSLITSTSTCTHISGNCTGFSFNCMLMSNTVTTAANRVVVITTVQPAGNGMGVTSAPHFMGQTVSKKLGRFQLGHPKALGTVQIMIALVMLLIGIVMAWSPRPDNIGVLSGIFVYGSIIFVIAGSLTVAADNHLNKCRVKGSLGMNVVAAVTSFFGLFLYSMDTGGIMLYFYCNHPSSHGQYYNTDIFNCVSLHFIVSICVSSFGCKAVCQCCKCCHTPEVRPVQCTVYSNIINMSCLSYESGKVSKTLIN
uniref:Uncharacterized protein n=1 Tax=Esox lucius TaxID=8010 RepID=A0A3P8Y225_ESOLU